MNQKIWQIYRESTKGKELIELFSTDIWSEENNAKKGFDPFEIVKSIFVHTKKWGPATDDGVAIADFDIIDLNLSSRITIPENLSNAENYDRFINDLDLLECINGQELSAKDYLELLRMVEEKGGNTDDLPRLYKGGLTEFGKIENEKDVEEKILIPFLIKLGYSEADWTRQLMLKAGRKEKAIPDFVFFATGERHFENAPFIIEAKFDMSLMTEQHRAFSQCVSYARMLRSSLMGICDKERLIIYKADKHGTFDRGQPFFENHWQAIYADELVGAKLLQIIGREAAYGLCSE